MVINLRKKNKFPCYGIKPEVFVSGFILKVFKITSCYSLV